MSADIPPLALPLLALLVGAHCIFTTVSARTPVLHPSLLMSIFMPMRTWFRMMEALGVAFLIGKAGPVLLFAFVSFASLRDYMTLTGSRHCGADRCALLSLFFVVIPVQYYLVWIGSFALFAIFIPVYCFLAMPALTALRGETSGYLERVSGQQWGAMIAIYCISHIPALAALPVPGIHRSGFVLVALLIASVNCNDMLRYLARRFLTGRTTASIMGIIGTALIGAALARLTPFSPLEVAALAGMAAFMGLCGQITASMIKRSHGVTTWEDVVAGGHMAMLDHVISIAFAAPPFFHVVRYLWT